MYIKILNNGVIETYTDIRNLSFAPEVDITGQSLPVNEFSVDVYTQNEISVAQKIALYDDLKNLWAYYYIVVAERISVDVVSIRAESLLARMDRSYVDEEIYLEPKSIAEIIYELFAEQTNLYKIAPELRTEAITGYFPRQSRKERLQWVCFAIGAYVKTFFSSRIEILKIDAISKDIPIRKTYWRPSLTHRDYIKSITIPYFSFTPAPQQQAENADEHIKVGNDYYIVNRTNMVLNNNNPPVGVAMQEIEVEDVYIISVSNVSAVLNRLAGVYFKNEELEAEIVNNAEFLPSELARISVDPPDENTGRIARGYIDSCNFSFGMQAKSKIHMVVQQLFKTNKLVINYLHVNGVQLGSEEYAYPVGYDYIIDNPYLDQNDGVYQKVYYPKKKQATGTMKSGTNVNNQYFDDALIYDKSQNERGVAKNILEILSVNSITVDTESRVITVE